MQVSNQSSANALLAHSKDRMNPQQLQLRKLFAQKQQQLGIQPGGAAGLGATNPADAAKAMKAAARLDPALAATATGGKQVGGPIGKWFGTGSGAPGDAGNATIAPLPAELASELTVEGLMSRWGQSDAAYDLDKSGTVGMNDLVMLLSEQGPTTAAPPAKTAPDGDPVEELLTLGTTDPMAPVGGEGEGEGDGAPAPELTMEGLMKSWGSDDPMYDLDGDGTVGMNDLLTMLAQSGVDPAQSVGNTATPGDPGTPDDPAAELTVDGFSAAWGSDDPMYDLDGDGTVGMNDLLAHLATITPSGSGETVPANQSVPGELGVNAPPIEADLLSDTAPKIADVAKPDGGMPEVKPEMKPEAFDPASTLAATLDAIAKDPGDVNPLGTTGPVGGDVTTGSETAALDPAMLGGPSSYWNMAGTIAGEGSIGIETLAGLTDPTSQAGAIQTPEAAADIIAKQLHERLDSFGFNDAPPSNLHEILDGLHLADGDRKMVLERMQGMYPDGLGLNLVG